MLESIRQFFERRMAQPPDTAGAAEHDRVQVAACALLLELAHADETFTDDERAHIEDALQRHFALDLDTARELIALAERERVAAVDLYQFTSLITSHYDEGQRLLLAEIMWRVVYADGELAKREDYLMQRIAKLLDLRPGYLAEAKRRGRKAPGGDA